MQNYKSIISGEPGVGTPFSKYPETINGNFETLLSNSSGASAPGTPILYQLWYDTTTQAMKIYLGGNIGWASLTATDASVSEIQNILNNAKGEYVSLEERILWISRQNQGTSFPTKNIQVGMPCFRTDLQAIYICTGVGTGAEGANEWKHITEVMPQYQALLAEINKSAGETASLSARLDTALNPDGSLKGTAPAGEWWEPLNPYTFETRDATSFYLEGDLRALFEVGRALYFQPSFTRGVWVEDSTYDEVENKTAVVVSANLVEGDDKVQFGAPVNNGPAVADVPHATTDVFGLVKYATDEQMQTLTPEQLAFYSANAGQIKTLFSDLNAFFDEKDFTFNAVTDGWYVLDGQNVVLSATQMAKAQAKATSQPELFKTEAEWQALSTEYGGVGGVTYFVLDTVGGTLRLPDLRGMYAQSKETAREVFEAGLPNILGSFAGRTGAVSGAFSDVYLTTSQAGTGIGLATIGFDASRSNAIYGNSATVTPNTYTTVKCVYLGV